MTTDLSLTGALPSLGPSLPDTSAATTYTDLNGLAALKADPNSPQARSAVAEQVEALFLQMMLKSMRDASMGDELDGNGVGGDQDGFAKQLAPTLTPPPALPSTLALPRQSSRHPAPPPPTTA